MAISGITGLGSALQIGPTTTSTKTAGASSTGSDGFGGLIGKALDSVQGAQSAADGMEIQAATGQLTDVHDFMIASTQAQLATELTVAVRNKAVDAFKEIMGMQV